MKTISPETLQAFVAMIKAGVDPAKVISTAHALGYSDCSFELSAKYTMFPREVPEAA